MLNSKQSPLADLIKRKSSHFILNQNNPILVNTADYKIPSNENSLFSKHHPSYPKNQAPFTSSLKKQFGSTSPIPRASSISNNSSSQMSYKKFVKQTQNHLNSKQQSAISLGQESIQPATNQLLEWKGFTHHFIAKKLNQALEKSKKSRDVTLNVNNQNFNGIGNKNNLFSSSINVSATLNNNHKAANMIERALKSQNKKVMKTSYGQYNHSNTKGIDSDQKENFIGHSNNDMSPSISIYDQSMIMDENSPHKNIKDIGTGPGPNVSNSFMNMQQMSARMPSSTCLLNETIKQKKQIFNQSRKLKDKNCEGCLLERKIQQVTENALQQAVDLALDLYDEYEKLKQMRDEIIDGKTQQLKVTQSRKQFGNKKQSIMPGGMQGIQEIYAGDVGRKSSYDESNGGENDSSDESVTQSKEKPFKFKSATINKSPFKKIKGLKSYKDSVINFENSTLFMEDYQPISKYIDMRKIRQSPNFTVKKYQESIYIGEEDKTNLNREGLGIMIYKSGRVYEGPWVSDYRQGQGFEKYQNSNTYEGNFHRGKPEGKGIYRWLNNDTYEGEWYQGLKHGYGVWVGKKGDSYIGEWRNSKVEGYGIHIYKNGDRYEGEWKGCLKHGKGVELFANGEVFIGYYKQGRFEGYGQYMLNDGSIYEGDFQVGMKSGHGRWRRQKDDLQSNTYEGQYVSDKKHGYGTFKWGKSGNIFKGEYRNDDREGFGEMKWIDGSFYIGQWEKGIQHGYGRIVFPDGTTKEGYFENNIFRGAMPPAYHISENSMYKRDINTNNLEANSNQLSKRNQAPIDLNNAYTQTLGFVMKTQEKIRRANTVTQMQPRRQDSSTSQNRLKFQEVSSPMNHYNITQGMSRKSVMDIKNPITDDSFGNSTQKLKLFSQSSTIKLNEVKKRSLSPRNK